MLHLCALLQRVVTWQLLYDVESC